MKLEEDFVEASLDGVQVTNEGAFPLPLQLQAGQKANTKLQSKFPTTPMNRPLERENDIAWWTTGFEALPTHCLKIIAPKDSINGNKFNDIYIQKVSYTPHLLLTHK